MHYVFKNRGLLWLKFSYKPAFAIMCLEGFLGENIAGGIDLYYKKAYLFFYKLSGFSYETLHKYN